MARAADAQIVINPPLGLDLTSVLALEDTDFRVSSLGELMDRHLSGHEFYSDRVDRCFRRGDIGMNFIKFHTCVFMSV